MTLTDVGQVIAAILLAAVAIFAIKVAFLFLILAGLIFRTKQTIAILIMLAAWAAFKASPVIGWLLIGVIVIIAVFKAATKKPESDASVLTDETSA